MGAYQGRQKFYGAFDEDLNSTLGLYDTLCRICRMFDTEKAEGVLVMLRDDALNFYLKSTLEGDTFETIVKRFRDHNMTPEERN